MARPRITRVNFRHIFDKFASKTKKVFAHDRSQTVGASEAFACIRQVGYKKQNVAKDPNSTDKWGAAMRGDMIEANLFVPALTKYLPSGVTLLGAGKHQKTKFSGRLSATPDGLAIDVADDFLAEYGIPSLKEAGSTDDSILIECKSIDPRVNLDEEKSIHHGQAQVQMGLVRETTDFKPEFCVILYIDASFLDDISVFIVKWNPTAYKVAKERADLVFNTPNPDELKPEGRMLGTECKMCQWEKRCRTTILGDVPDKEADGSGMDELILDLEPRVKRLLEAKDTEKEAKLVVKEAEGAVKEVLKEANVSRVSVPGLTAIWSKVKGKRSFSKDLMIEKGLDPDDFMKEGSGHDRLTVSLGAKTSRASEDE